MNFFQNDSNWKEADFKIQSGTDLIHHTKNIAWFPDGNTNPYINNSKAYRSKEFEKDAELLFAGCSITYGEGVVEPAIWGNIIASKLNINAFNIGISGASVHLIVNNLFNYFKEFGNPKNLICMFPDFLRMQMYSNSAHMRSDSDNNTIKHLKEHRSYHLLLNINDEYAKISKQPHLASKVIPKELAMSLSIQHIKFLEMYCLEAGINLLWGTWSEEEESYILKNKLEFKNFVYLKNDLWHKMAKDNRKCLIHKNNNERNICVQSIDQCKNLETCHEDEKKIYGKNFDLAFDTHPDRLNTKHGHVGAHQHIHWAEEFISRMETL
jgi:hypothetical protein